jgi:photosystem II stability/assembly factor-like uncharacterized protein
MQSIRLTLLLAVTALTGFAAAQSPVSASAVWQMQESGTTAGLRGVFSVDGTVAWASGTGGTVLRTIDGGAHWTKCAVPDTAKDGATLDFRGVQAWDAQTAIVMSSGKGKLSRLYKTTDACKAWKRIFTNPDRDGFWDALYFDRGQYGWLLGDPVRGMFSLFASDDGGRYWVKQRNKGLRVGPETQGAFAASNSSLSGLGSFGSGGTGGAFVFSLREVELCIHCSKEESDTEGRRSKWSRDRVPVGKNTDSSGIFSIGTRHSIQDASTGYPVLVAVGGDYSGPNELLNTAAFKLSYDQPWTASTTPPHGFRSAVQWSESLNAWITVGTNGSDISRDDGKTWHPLDDGNWNALSLPFVVGPNGRIARLNSAVLP